MATNPHYLYRMTILQAISLLGPVMGAEITCSKLLPVVVDASKDRYYSSIVMMVPLIFVWWFILFMNDTIIPRTVSLSLSHCLTHTHTHLHLSISLLLDLS